MERVDVVLARGGVRSLSFSFFSFFAVSSFSLLCLFIDVLFPLFIPSFFAIFISFFFLVAELKNCDIEEKKNYLRVLTSFSTQQLKSKAIEKSKVGQSFTILYFFFPFLSFSFLFFSFISVFPFSSYTLFPLLVSLKNFLKRVLSLLN